MSRAVPSSQKTESGDRVPVAGWYPDPAGADALRWWNGTAWTGHLMPRAGAAHEGAQLPRRRSGRRAWTLWTVAVVGSLVASLLALSVIAAFDGAGCGDAPTAHERASGLRDLAEAAVLLAAAWGVAAAANRRRWRRIVLGAAIGLAPLVLFALTHLTVGSWNDGACFF